MGREVRWAFSNLALLVVYAYLVQIGFGLIKRLAGIPSNWGGDPFVEALGWATAAGTYMFIFAPVGLFYILPYRLLAGWLRRPRATAFVFSALGVLSIWLISPERDVQALVGWELAAAGYAAIVRPPGDGLGSLPPVARSAIAGILLSMVWIVGSVAAVIWSTAQASRGRWLEAGTLAVTATVGPALLMFLDLFRDNVPETNRLVTGLLVLAVGMGAFLVTGSLRPRSPDAHPS